MEQLICASCAEPVAGRSGRCVCGAILSLPGAVIALPSEDPPSPDAVPPVEEHPPVTPEMLPRTYWVLTPWGDRIEIPEGTSLGVGRDPEFCAFADRMDEAPFVSRRHLFLRVEGGLLHVRDLGSLNGTTRNGTTIDADTDVALVATDSITLGGQVTFFVA